MHPVRVLANDIVDQTGEEKVSGEEKVRNRFSTRNRDMSCGVSSVRQVWGD